MFGVHSYMISLVFFLVISLPQVPARLTPKFTSDPATVITVKDNKNTWHEFGRFLDSRKGSHVGGMSELKRYFHRFGYLPVQEDLNFTDAFDATFERAVARYQANLGLPVTGSLDSDTVSLIMSPRCGVPDYRSSTLHGTGHFAYFTGQPRWSRDKPINLTYAFSPENMIQSPNLSAMRGVFKRAFGRWASVIPVSFSEANDYGFADIKIGFYSGDHGDGEPFDGVLGVLAHSFSPESGRFHLDAAETWAVDFETEKSKVAVDLESVATHEIGHLLGLAHSSIREAVMYPSLKPRSKKLELSRDDISGIQELYGSNPNFRFESSLESDISSNQAVDLSVTSSTWAILLLVLISCLCI